MPNDPNLIDPTATVQQRVAPLPTFKGVREDGTVVTSHPPLPTRKAAGEKAYHCSVNNASFHRPDGKRLGFVFNYFATDIQADIDYLDKEIAEGNPYLRHATEDEIVGAKMRMNPKETMRSIVREELLNDPSLRQQIEAQVRAELEAKIQGATVVSAPSLLSIEKLSDQQVFSTQEDANKLAGTDSLKARLEALKQGRGDGTVVKTDNATVLHQGVPPLKGIVSTASIAEGAAASGGQTGEV